MNQIWLQIFVAMIGGSIVKGLISNSWVWVFVDIAVLVICYLILRRHSNVDLKGSMLFLSGLTIVSILMDIGIIGGLIGNILILVMLGWMVFGRGGNNSNNTKRPSIRHKWHK